MAGSGGRAGQPVEEAGTWTVRGVRDVEGVTDFERTYTTRPLSPETWDDFAALVEANNGVWGGCWCMGFHPEGVGKGSTIAGNRAAKRAHVDAGTVHQTLVYDGDVCVGWCQYGAPAELPSIKNPAAYARGVVDLPAWRIAASSPAASTAEPVSPGRPSPPP
jgi:hypothetical protein